MRRVLLLFLILAARPATGAESVALELQTGWFIANAWPEQLSFNCDGYCPAAEVRIKSGADEIGLPRTPDPVAFGDYTDFDERLKVFFRNDPPVDRVTGILTLPTSHAQTTAF